MSNLAKAKKLTFGKHRVRIELDDGCSLCIPLECFPPLSNATSKQRKNCRICDSGNGLHWDDLNHSVSMEELVAMTSLKEIMECKLKDWKSRLLPSCWKDAIGDVQLDFSALDSATGKILCNDAWPHDNYIFKAFHRVAPNDVRVVIFGNEPYSKACRSTGRAFEQGDIDSFNDDGAREKIADSLRGLILALLMTNCSDGKLNGLADCGKLAGQTELFDWWENHGVVWLNTSLTFSSKAHSDNHRNLWRPFITNIINGLVNRDQDPVIFAAWGKEAQDEMKRSLRNQSGSTKFYVLRSAHPASYGCQFFADGNPLFAINRKLRSLDLQDIPWWPIDE